MVTHQNWIAMLLIRALSASHLKIVVASLLVALLAAIALHLESPDLKEMHDSDHVAIR